MNTLMIDSTIVRAHQHSAGAKSSPERESIERGRGGLSTKTHAIVNTLGNPTSIYLTSRQNDDLDGADVLLPETEADTVIADRGYNAMEKGHNSVRAEC